MDWIIETFWTSRTYNDVFTVMFFWMPMAFNAVAYTLRIFERIGKDKAAIRGDEDFKYHHDWLRAGHLIGYTLATFLPLVNLLWFIFDTMAELWSMAWRRLAWLFELRLVPGEKPERR